MEQYISTLTALFILGFAFAIMMQVGGKYLRYCKRLVLAPLKSGGKYLRRKCRRAWRRGKKWILLAGFGLFLILLI